MAQAFFDYDQLKRSFYMFFFQTPLADMVVGMNDLEFIDRLWADWSPGYDAHRGPRHVKDALRDPANLTAAIGYYRAIFTSGGIPGGGPAAHAVPPRRQRRMSRASALTEGAEAHLPPGSQVEIVEGAGHFLHLEQPDEVNQLIVDWVTRS